MNKFLENISATTLKSSLTCKERISSLDVMKCFAAFSVVCIHYFNDKGCLFTPIFRCAVPIFLMITGYYYDSMKNSGNFWKHIRKLLCLAFFSSMLYGIFELQSQIYHGNLRNWVEATFQPSHILDMMVFTNDDLFGYHLWYFWAVLYDLILFYFADKWHLKKLLVNLTPILLLIFFVGNFTPWSLKFRNFLFLGLPCMMIGRLIREKQNIGLFLCSHKICIVCYVLIFYLLIRFEIIVLDFIYNDQGIRNMYVFSLPLILPFFYLALRNPFFCKNSLIATIGRKYSAYIYIFHVLVARGLVHLLSEDNCLFAFVVFAVSLFVSWLFMRITDNVKKKVSKIKIR